MRAAKVVLSSTLRQLRWASGNCKLLITLLLHTTQVSSRSIYSNVAGTLP